MIPKALQKISREKAGEIMIVSFWPSQAWFPKFLYLVETNFIVLGPQNSLLLCPYSFRTHPLAKSLQLLAAIVSGSFC